MVRGPVHRSSWFWWKDNGTPRNLKVKWGSVTIRGKKSVADGGVMLYRTSSDLDLEKVAPVACSYIDIQCSRCGMSSDLDVTGVVSSA